MSLHELNGVVVSLQLDILASLSGSSENVKLITYQKGLAKLLEILKIYDFDRNIVAKCLEIVHETLPYDQNIDIIINYESIQILNSQIRFHRDADHILFTVRS